MSTSLDLYALEMNMLQDPVVELAVGVQPPLLAWYFI